MEGNMDELVAALTTTTLCDDILSKITNLLEKINSQSLLKFISDNFDALSTLERWSWEILGSNDPIQWANQPKYSDFFHSLASFNKNFIFNLDEMDSDKKATLLIPQTLDLINNVFDQITTVTDDNDLYFIMISLWFDNLSYFIYEHTEFLKSSIITEMEYSIICKCVMTDQYKFYLTQLQQPVITLKQLFYIKTCSFSISSYLLCKYQKFPFSGDEILRHFAKDYIELIRLHSSNVSSWNKELLSCITHLINFSGACLWWSGDRDKCLKILLPTTDIYHEHIQSLVCILNHKPFHQQIQVHRSNDETILIDAILSFTLVILQGHDLVCFMRSKTNLLDILLPLAETSGYNRISLCAYAMLGELLSDEHLKELKITHNMNEYFFYMLEHAWQHPAQKFRRTSVPQLLRSFLNLAKNDSIQQRTADMNKVLLLIEMCDQYPMVFDIIWALSFNHDIQQQLRSNSSFMMKLTHLAKGADNEQMRKITHGILWNLEIMHEDRIVSENEDQTTFDIMISYSHKDKTLCKRIYDELIKSGYRVWIDFDQMHGNVMDAMAQAIERSNTILICMSEQYRRSSYCRAEAYYAFQRQLKIVPVLLENHYKPDGWLLFLIGQLLYVDYTKYEFSRAMQMLFKELDAPMTQEQNVLPHGASPDYRLLAASLPIPLPMSVSRSVSDNILEWSESEVQEWLTKQNLTQMSRLLMDYNGSSLIYLNKYLEQGDSQQILKLLQDDSIRRTTENLSLVELARLQSLLGQQQRLLPAKNSKQKSKKASHRHKWMHWNSCKIM